ncbi:MULTISPECIES: hemerythrin domain-containing protein [unclassified Thioalkalivibrio]|uniref:hemerythrin domain-containing protein n=1 Tax=unclassified Thioalkalivibrio TaxID=2621013 RepID=UPI00036C6CD8|nr:MULTISPECIES: hemerythrin domain-containing protein [unclassified Thioalkalivibrio]
MIEIKTGRERFGESRLLVDHSAKVRYPMHAQLHESVPGFQQPIELLRACHRRILNSLDILERLPAHLADKGADEEARGAAQRVLNYFHEAAPNHHADEDQDLFPVLRQHCGHPESHPQLCEWLDRLTAEHDEIEAGWDRLEPALQRIAAGQPADLDGADAWIRQYRIHLDLEERAVLPFAEHLLGPEDRRAIGAAMAARRGIASADRG